jgi:hypothetical protein
VVATKGLPASRDVSGYPVVSLGQLINYDNMPP